MPIHRFFGKGRCDALDWTQGKTGSHLRDGNEQLHHSWPRALERVLSFGLYAGGLLPHTSKGESHSGRNG